MAYGLTTDEQARLDAVPWPYKFDVARQVDTERAERESAARAAEDRRRYEEQVAWVQWTHRKAEEETRKHRLGLPCVARYCHYEV